MGRSKQLFLAVSLKVMMGSLPAVHDHKIVSTYVGLTDPAQPHFRPYILCIHAMGRYNTSQAVS